VPLGVPAGAVFNQRREQIGLHTGMNLESFFATIPALHSPVPVRHRTRSGLPAGSSAADWRAHRQVGPKAMVQTAPPPSACGFYTAVVTGPKHPVKAWKCRQKALHHGAWRFRFCARCSNRPGRRPTGLLENASPDPQSRHYSSAYPILWLPQPQPLTQHECLKPP